MRETSVPTKVLREWIRKNKFGKYVEINKLEDLVKAYEDHTPKHGKHELNSLR